MKPISEWTTDAELRQVQSNAREGHYSDSTPVIVDLAAEVLRLRGELRQAHIDWEIRNDANLQLTADLAEARAEIERMRPVITRGFLSRKDPS